MTNEDIFKVVVKEKPRFHVGKDGLTPASVEELKHLLDKQRVIKVKINKNILAERSKASIAREAADKLSAFLIEIRGNTFILSKRSIPNYQRKIPPA